MEVSETAVETYEALYRRLETIVARLEGGEIALDEMIQLYEEGVGVAAACQRLIDSAELRVRQLQQHDEFAED